MLAGLMSRWMSRPSALGERLADLAQDVDDPARRKRPFLADEAIQVEAVEVLHHVIEGAFRRAAVVVDRDRVRVVESRGQLRLALEAFEPLGAGASRGKELDRGAAAKHLVLGAVHDAHAALADLLISVYWPSRRAQAASGRWKVTLEMSVARTAVKAEASSRSTAAISLASVVAQEDPGHERLRRHGDRRDPAVRRARSARTPPARSTALRISSTSVIARARHRQDHRFVGGRRRPSLRHQAQQPAGGEAAAGSSR
jgi:hypothetical protein